MHSNDAEDNGGGGCRVNKELEKHYLDQFVKTYHSFPEGSIVPSERPDFIVRQGNRNIGIELCRLYKDSRDDSLSIQAQKSWKANLLKRACELFEKESNEKYRVFISFEERTAIQKNNIDEISTFISQKIIEKIKSIKPKEGSPIILGEWDLQPCNNIVSMIQVYDFSKYNDYSWTQNNVFNVEVVNSDNLAKIIGEKETLREDYQKCDEMWLLVVIDFWDLAMDQSIPTGFNLKIRNSKFDRIFLFKTIEEEVIEVK